MSKNIFTRGRSLPLNRKYKIAVAGVGTLGAAAVAVALTVVPASGQTTTSEAAAPKAKVAYSTKQIQNVHADGTGQLASAGQRVAAIATKQEAAAKETASKKAAAKREAKQSASRLAERTEVRKSYPNNLDGWIREARAILAKHDIPGTYEGIHRNIMRESSGKPKAINLWDINAQHGIPSKGLLQVIPPTFKAYHVPGTSWNIYDPVANIAAACNYAADKYGTMDNVNSAY